MENVIYDKSWFDHEPVMAVLLNNQPSEKNNLDRTSDSSTYQDFVSLPYKEDNFSNCNDIIFIDGTSLQGTGLFESTYFNVVDKLQIECMFFLNTGTPETSEPIADEVIIPPIPDMQYPTDLNYVVESHAVQLYGESIEVVRQSYPPSVIYSETEANIIINAIDTPVMYVDADGIYDASALLELESVIALNVILYRDDGSSYPANDIANTFEIFINEDDIEDTNVYWEYTSNYRLRNIIVDEELTDHISELYIKWFAKVIGTDGTEDSFTFEMRVSDVLYLQLN